jgi:hypothetical protein
MFFAMFLMGGLLYCSGTSLGLSKDQIIGWRVLLEDSEMHCGAFSRAVAGTFEGIVSPLSVLSLRRMVVPDQSWVAIIQVLYGYFCLTMVLLFGFSVRRRFKIG